MIILCKIDIFLLLIFIFYSIWLKTIDVLTSKNYSLHAFFMVMYFILTVMITFLSIRCGHWFLFEYWRWGI